MVGGIRADVVVGVDGVVRGRWCCRFGGRKSSLLGNGGGGGGRRLSCFGDDGGRLYGNLGSRRLSWLGADGGRFGSLGSRRSWFALKVVTMSKKQTLEDVSS